MAIKKYRVAHGVESIILGILICAGLALVFAAGEKPNMTQNKEIAHLNRIYQDKIANMGDGTAAAAKDDEIELLKQNIEVYKKQNEAQMTNVNETVSHYFSDDEFQGQVQEILNLSATLESKIVELLKNQKCKEKQDCNDKMEKLRTLLQIPPTP